MMSKVVLLALVSVACAASVEKRQGTQGSAPVAQARDGQSSGHGGSSYAALAPASYGEGGSQGPLYGASPYAAPAPTSYDEGGSQELLYGSSSYAAPAPSSHDEGVSHGPLDGGSSYASPSPVSHDEGGSQEPLYGGSSYADPAPASHDEGGSQGLPVDYNENPVSDHGSSEIADDRFDILGSVILPLIIIGSALLILSYITYNLTSARALSNEPRESSVMDQLQDEIERAFYIYLNAFESEQCIQRTICHLGTYAKDFKGKNFVLSLVETLVPEGMKNNVAIFAKAATSGYDTGKCKQFRCVAPKLLDN